MRTVEDVREECGLNTENMDDCGIVREDSFVDMLTLKDMLDKILNEK